MKYLILILSLFSATLAFGQKEGEVTVNRTNAVDFLVEKQVEINEKTDTEPGFRIQISYSNAKSDVTSEQGKFYNHFPKLKTYVVYELPYYKLRVGDYITRLEATQVLDEIQATYPSAFVVVDNVKSKNIK